jgi:hypothetical protein
MTEFPAASNGTSPGLLFSFSYGAGIPLDQSDAIVRSVNRAAAGWSSYLRDGIALSGQVEWVDMPAPAVGGARPAMVKVNYKDFMTALLDDYTSERDWAALNSLQLGGQDRATLRKYASGEIDPSKVKLDTDSFSQLIDSRFTSEWWQRNGVLDQNGNENNKKIWITRANAKALGLVKEDDKKLDFIIQMNRSVQWDFDQSDGIKPGTYDFTSVFQHELGHVLGFVSGVDAFEWLNLTQDKTLTEKNLTYVSPMDLFRFSTESAQSGAIDMRIGGGIEKFFSLDGGKTRIADFSTGGLIAGGDGYQASHWKLSTPALGIMQPNVQSGQTLSISPLDLQLLDVIGWDLDVETPLARKATAAGLDWNRILQDLNQSQQSTIQTLGSQWAANNPGYTIEPDLRELANRLEVSLNREIDKKISELNKKTEKVKDPNKRSKEIASTTSEIFELQVKQNEKLAKFVKDRENLDLQVRKWLDSDAKKLSEELRAAVGVEIQKLAEIINNAPAPQKAVWEAKLNEAFSSLTDKPSKAVEEVLKTTGPGNPLGWRRWFWGWVQTGSSEDPALSGFINNIG